MPPRRPKELVLRRDGTDSVVSGEAGMRPLLGPALQKVLETLARRALLAAPA